MDHQDVDQHQILAIDVVVGRIEHQFAGIARPEDLEPVERIDVQRLDEGLLALGAHFLRVTVD